MSYRCKTDTEVRADFQRQIANHVMHVIRDDGLYRNLRFRRPDSWCMGFDILTWPGHLCYTGDMGSFLFQRLEDMLQFFRAGKGRARGRMDMNYWAEKVQASDRHGGVTEFSPMEFRALVRSRVDDLDEVDGWTPERIKSLWKEIEEQVLNVAEDGEHAAFAALYSFEHDGFDCRDFETNCHQFTYRFVWCCHAIEWAVDTYDAHKATAADAGDNRRA